MRPHLDNGEQSIQPIKVSPLGLDWHADDGQRRECSHHAWEVGGTASARDQNTDATRMGCAGVLQHAVGRPAGGQGSDPSWQQIG